MQDQTDLFYYEAPREYDYNALNSDFPRDDTLASLGKIVLPFRILDFVRTPTTNIVLERLNVYLNLAKVSHSILVRNLVGKSCFAIWDRYWFHCGTSGDDMYRMREYFTVKSFEYDVWSVLTTRLQWAETFCKVFAFLVAKFYLAIPRMQAACRDRMAPNIGGIFALLPCTRDRQALASTSWCFALAYRQKSAYKECFAGFHSLVSHWRQLRKQPNAFYSALYEKSPHIEAYFRVALGRSPVNVVHLAEWYTWHHGSLPADSFAAVWKPPSTKFRLLTMEKPFRKPTLSRQQPSKRQKTTT